MILTRILTLISTVSDLTPKPPDSRRLQESLNSQSMIVKLEAEVSLLQLKEAELEAELAQCKHDLYLKSATVMENAIISKDITVSHLKENLSAEKANTDAAEVALGRTVMGHDAQMREQASFLFAPLCGFVLLWSRWRH